MSDQPFLAAIAARPEDVAARLAYADWLEERGDTRADLIRLQEELTGLSPYADRFWELKPRRDELRKSVNVNSSWLQFMRYGDSYCPLFSRLPERRDERWRLVRLFLEHWDNPLEPGSGNTEEEIERAEQRLRFRLPAALREWYQLAGRRKERTSWSVPKSWCELHALQVDRSLDALIFRWLRHQDYAHWGIRTCDLHQDDPPVYLLYRNNLGHEKVKIESPTTTAFAILTVLLETMFLSHFGVWSRVRKEDSESEKPWVRRRFFSERFRGLVAKDPMPDELRGRLTQCDLPTTFWGTTQVIYEGTDMLCVTHPNPTDGMPHMTDGALHIAARSKSAIESQLSAALYLGLNRWA